MTREVDVDNEDFGDAPRLGRGRQRVAGLRGFVVFCMLVVAVLIGWLIYRVVHHKAAPTQTNQTESLPALATHNFDQTPPVPPTPPPAEQPKTPEAVPQATPQQNPNAPKKPRQLTPEERAFNRRLGHDLSANDASSIASSALTGAGKSGEHRAPSEESRGLGDKMTGSHPPTVMATQMPHPSLIVAQGTMLMCGLKTELDTTQPGMVACHISRDVYSADGKVRLIDKGAIVTGEIASGLHQGQRRIFVLWTRLRNPDNTLINLDSPGTNRLGSAGIPGEVNSHFWDRFGSAIMFSVLGDVGQGLVQAASNSTAKSGTSSFQLNDTQQTTNQLATTALQNSINIPPTLWDAQGDLVSIFVARDLDFSDVYGLALSGSGQ